MEALHVVLGGLPADFPAAVIVVLHSFADLRSQLLDGLGRSTRLRVTEAEADEFPTPGVVYIAPVDHHLLIRAHGLFSLSQSPKVHGFRPAADPLFSSAAVNLHERLIAVVLDGRGRDGAAGVGAVQRCGGAVVVQDPESAKYAEMPAAALATGAANYLLPLKTIAAGLQLLVRRMMGEVTGTKWPSFLSVESA